MKRGLACVLSLTAVGCASDDPLTFEVKSSLSGMPFVQGPALKGARTTDSDLDEDFDAGEGEEESADETIGVSSACADASLSALRSGLDASTYAVVPPLYDVDYNSVLRPVEVVLLDGSRCASIATLSDADSSLLQTGFGSSIDDPPTALASQGLMLRLLDLTSELVLFSNSTERFWTIDPDTGVVTADDRFERPVTGAIEDGEGGAWIVQAGGLAFDGDYDISEADSLPALLTHLDEDFEILETISMPTKPQPTGITVLPNGEMVGWPMFLSNDLTFGPDDNLYVLDSSNAQIIEVDPDSGDTRPISLDVTYPTAIAYQAEKLLINSSLRIFVADATPAEEELLDEEAKADAERETLSQAPGLRTVDLSDGSTTLEMVLPAPADGWLSNPGLINVLDDSTGEGVVMLNWLDIAEVGTGDLIVADPAENRVLYID